MPTQRVRSGVGGWWTRQEENGYWCLIVSKQDFQIGVDPWGFRPGELASAVRALVPRPPEIITSAAIAEQLYRDGGEPTRRFMKAIHYHLRLLRKKGFAQSVPYGEAPQLGWHTAVAGLGSRPHRVIGPPASHNRTRAVLTPKVDKENSVGPGLQGRVLAIIAASPAPLSASSISAEIEAFYRLPVGSALKATRNELVALHRLKHVQMMAGSNSEEIEWTRL